LLIIIFVILLVSVFAFYVLINTSPAIEKFFQNMELSFSESPVLNKEVELTLTVTPPLSISEDAWIKILSQNGNFAPKYYLEIILPEGFELIHGDLNWEGYTGPGETKQIKVIVKAIEEGNWLIGAWAGPEGNKKFDRDNLYIAV